MLYEAEVTAFRDENFDTGKGTMKTVNAVHEKKEKKEGQMGVTRV